MRIKYIYTHIFKKTKNLSGNKKAFFIVLRGFIKTLVVVTSVYMPYISIRKFSKLSNTLSSTKYYNKLLANLSSKSQLNENLALLIHNKPNYLAVYMFKRLYSDKGKENCTFLYLKEKSIL